MAAISASRLRLFLAALLISLHAIPGWAEETTIGQNELPIHDAARLGSRLDVEKLLNTHPDWRDARTPRGSTPLHFAALNVDSGPLKALIAAGADVNAKDKEGATPLHMAAFATRTEHARLLLEAGADVNAKTDASRDAMSMARKARADETAGMISIWVLKGCKAGKPC